MIDFAEDDRAPQPARPDALPKATHSGDTKSEGSHYMPDERTQFDALLRDWTAATARIPSPTQWTRHESARPIIDHPRATEYLVANMRLAAAAGRASPYVVLMQSISDAPPYEGIEPGDMKAMTRAWVAWYDRQPT